MKEIFLAFFGGNKGEESASSDDEAKVDQGVPAPEFCTSTEGGQDRDTSRKRSPTPFGVDRYRAAGLRRSGSGSPSPDPLAMDRDYDECRDSRYGVGNSKTRDDEQESRNCRRKIEVPSANPYNTIHTSSSSSSSRVPQHRDLSKDIKSSRGRDNHWPRNHDKRPHHNHRPHQQQQPKKTGFSSNTGHDIGNGYGGRGNSATTSATTASSAVQRDFEVLRKQREENRTGASSHHGTSTTAERRYEDERERDRDRNRNRNPQGRDNFERGSSRSRRDDDRARTVEREHERDRPKDCNRDQSRPQPLPAQPRTPEFGTTPMDLDSPLPADASKRDEGGSGVALLPFTREPSNQQQPPDRDSGSSLVPPTHPPQAAAPMDITTINDSGAQANQNQANGFTQYSWPPAQDQTQPGSKSLPGWRNDHDDGGRAAWGAEKRELEKIIEQKTTEAQIQEAANLDLHQQLAEANMAISELRQNNKDLSDTLHTERERAREIKSALSTHEQLKWSYQRLGREYTSKMELLNTRTEELALAQAYMTTADTCSVADISRMVEQLNDDIYQFAVLFSDAVLNARSSKTPVAHEAVVKARRALEETWSKGLVEKMHMAVAEEDTVLLECFLQHALANWCHDVVRSFVDNPEAEDFLQALWEGINRSQEPSIARNWLAITFSELKTQELDSSYTFQDVDNLINASGWGPEGQVRDKLSEQAHSKFADLTAKARKIKEMVFEGILSADVRTNLALPEACYNPEEMEDAHNMGGRGSGGEGSDFVMLQNIVCTVGLGLVATRRREGPDKQSKMEERTVVLKPKVLLPSTLDNL